MSSAESISRFVNAAREYCAWCEGPRSANPRPLRAEAIRLLARLYTTALDLPEVGATDTLEPPTIESDIRDQVREGFASLPFRYYWQMFNPSTESKEDPVCGDLADDVTDIYLDVKLG